MSDKVLGIDLGTTNSGMSVVEGGDPQMLQNAGSERLTLSVVSVKDDGTIVVGSRADHRAGKAPDRTIREAKLDMGTDATYDVGDETYTPTDVSTEILKKLRTDAGDVLGTEVDEAVITVPAYFNADQKKATRKAGERAGFDSLELVNEPSAAALAYGYDQDLSDHTLLVYDFGGGTLDTSVLEVDGDDYTVLTTTGNNELGGTNFDAVIMEEIASRYEDDHSVHLLDDLDDSEIVENLRAAAEEAKIALSADEEVDIMEPYLGQMDGEIVTINTTLTRERFEEITADLREQARGPIEQAKEDTGLENGDFDEVLLVGGSTHIPSIQEMVEAETGTEPVMTYDPDKIVAQGAAIYAHEQADVGTGGVDYDCTECGTTFDTRKALEQHQIRSDHDGTAYTCEECGEEFDREADLEDHQDEEHGSKTGAGGGKVIHEIVPRSLGTGVKGGEMDVLIEKQTSLDDARKTKYYTTTKDKQTVVPVDVFQGEADRIEDNTKLEDFKLKGIDPMDAGEPIIEVTFWVDDDGILNVEAVDVTNGDDEGTRETLEVNQDVTGSSG